MFAFCPNCETETDQKVISEVINIDVRGEMILTPITYYLCNECGEDFEIPNPEYDPLDQAYREYRKRKGMLQPEEIRDFRKSLGLTQQELSNLLGIGIATLNRYENGALQSDAFDRVIRLYENPKNILSTLEKSPDLFAESTKTQLIQRLTQFDSTGGNLLNDAIENYSNYLADILCGYIKFDCNKLFQAMKYFGSYGGVGKTKLMKLLFYADFKHFKEYSVSITGSRYAHAHFGPVLDNFETWLVAVTDWTGQMQRDQEQHYDYIIEKYISKGIDYSVFSPSELSILAFVQEKFKNFTAKQIEDFSHEESGYINTKNGELISYASALDLQV